MFTRIAFKEVLVDSLKYCLEFKGLKLYAYVIMSNHIHIIVSAADGYSLSDIIRDFKKHTSKTILKKLIEGQGESRSEWMLKMFAYHAKYNKNNSKFQVWQRGNHPIELSSPKWINQKLAYIHNNPVRAGIVYSAEEYVYSSARWYSQGEGPLGVEILDFYNSTGYVDT